MSSLLRGIDQITKAVLPFHKAKDMPDRHNTLYHIDNR